jgi:hypothetical protein
LYILQNKKATKSFSWLNYIGTPDSNGTAALQHNLEETALTGILAILYYFVYIRASKTTLKSDLDDVE